VPLLPGLYDAVPAGVRTDLLMMAARAYLLEREGENPVRKFLFRWLLPKVRRVETLTTPLRWYQHLGLRRVVEKLHLDRLLPRRLREMSWLLPPIPRRPQRRLLPEVTPAQGERRHRVGYFLGCAQDVMFAATSEATVRVLARNGCEVVAPAVTCCGMPHVGYGEMEVAKELARQNIATFEQAGVEVVINDCASCGAQMVEYAELLSGDPAWAERARAFSSKVRDISAYLMEIGIEPPQGSVAMRVTYHDPCHLVRAQKVTKEPRQLLRMIPGLEYVEMAEADWCCATPAATPSPSPRARARSSTARWPTPPEPSRGHRQRLSRLPDAALAGGAAGRPGHAGTAPDRAAGPGLPRRRGER